MAEYKAVKQEGKWKFRGGRCEAGWHEGTFPNDWKGNPAPTCELFDKCACSCHLEVDRMFEAAGRPREPMKNTLYKPERRTWHMPDPLEWAEKKARERAQTSGHTVHETNPDEILAGKGFQQTYSGVRASSQLETQVFTVLQKIHPIFDVMPITPRFVAERIAEASGMEAPSQGAIQAAWDRWVAAGFAVEYGHKPVRFLGFTTDERPTLQDLETFREKYRQERRNDRRQESKRLVLKRR